MCGGEKNNNGGCKKRCVSPEGAVALQQVQLEARPLEEQRGTLIHVGRHSHAQHAEREPPARAGLPLSQFARPPYLLPEPLSLKGNNIISAAGTCASCLRVSLLVSDPHRVDGQPERLHPRLKIDSASKGNNDSVLVSRTRTDANRSERRRETLLTVTFECNK